MFQPKPQLEFRKKVTVVWPDDSTGTIDATFLTIPQDDLEAMLDLPATEFVGRVLKSPGPVGGPGGEALPEEQAKALVLRDSCAVSAIMAVYLDETKSKSFRGAKPGGRR